MNWTSSWFDHYKSCGNISEASIHADLCFTEQASAVVVNFPDFQIRSFDANLFIIETPKRVVPFEFIHENHYSSSSNLKV